MDDNKLSLVPPNNRDAEYAVLGSLLIDADAINAVREVLKPEAFYMEQNKWIYEALLALNDRNQPADLITVCDELRKQGLMEELGGEPYIIGLINEVPTSINAVHYAILVADAHERRKMIAVASAIANLAYDETIPLVEAVDGAQQQVYDLGKRVLSSSTVHIREPARDVLDLVEARAQAGSAVVGIPTGFTDLDRLVGGLSDAELVIVAGRPGMGKSSFQQSVAIVAGLKHKKRIGVFSLEMSSEQWAMRMVSGISNLDATSLRDGRLQEFEWPTFFDAVGKLSEAEIYIDDSPALTPSQIRAKCRRLDSEHGLDLVMIDYLQMMQTGKDIRNRVQQVSYITKSLKGLCKELNVPVLCTAQLSRAVEQRQDKRPQLADLRDSGNIEEDADQVWFIYRDDYYKPDDSDRPNIAELNVAKNRNGHRGQVDLYWNGRVTRFRNLQRQEIKL